MTRYRRVTQTLITMFTRPPRSEEITTLRWDMPQEAWDHWVQGKGDKSVRDVILEGLEQTRKNPDAIRKRCKEVAQEAQDEPVDVGQSCKHEIHIQLPSAGWAGACQRVGRINGNPVRTGQLLASLILDSESWKQSGNAEGNYTAGWNENSLISSLESLTATTLGVSLGRDEKRLAWIVTVAAAVTAVAAAASAIAAWFNA